MVLYKSQTGFTPIHLLLLLVILGIIGFAGWRVYDSSQVKDPRASTNSDQVPVLPPNDTSAPMRFTEYENKELGFKFLYPVEWGEAKTRNMKDQFPATKTGSRYQITFQNEAKITLGLRTRNWEYIPVGKDGPCDALGFNEYKSLETHDNKEYVARKILQATNYEATESYSVGGICGGFSITGLVQFKPENQFAGVELSYNYGHLVAYDEKEVQNYKNNPNDYFSEADRQRILNVIKSIKEI